MNPLIHMIIASNLIAFLQMGIDKYLSRTKKRRISEAQLIAPTLFGGILGTLLGMFIFRHKTKKGSFQRKLSCAFLLFATITYFGLRTYANH